MLKKKNYGHKNIIILLNVNNNTNSKANIHNSYETWKSRPEGSYCCHDMVVFVMNDLTQSNEQSDDKPATKLLR